MTEQERTEAVARAFLVQWMQDGCPYTDADVLEMFLALVPEDFAAICRDRQAQWRPAT